MKNKQLKWHTIIVLMITAIAVAGTFAMPAQAEAFPKKPGKIATVAVTKTGYDSVTLKWSASKSAKKYEIYQSTSKFGRYKLVKTVSGKSAKVRNLKTGTAYWFKVRGITSKRHGRFSKKVSACPTLAKPKLTAQTAVSGAKLTITKVPGASAYVIFRDGKAIARTKSNSFTDEGIAIGTMHEYKAVAYRHVGKKVLASELSNVCQASRVKLSVRLNGNTPVTTPLTRGSLFTIKGKIKANTNITKVVAGIVYSKTDKWVPGLKYVNKKLNTRSYSLKTVDNKLKFGTLKTGNYKFRIYVCTEDGTTTKLTDQSFKVENNAARKAVDWAIKIANDNSFNYGNKPACARLGCYFCGTNGTKVRAAGGDKRYEKTYVCITFITAAYAHGAGDPEMLDACKNKKACISLSETNFQRFSCWKLVGKCKDLTIDDLKPGDVIIRYNAKSQSPGHACMYCGGDQLVEAWTTGFSAKTIEAHDGAAKRLRTYGNDSSKNFVMRYTK